MLLKVLHAMVYFGFTTAVSDRRDRREHLLQLNEREYSKSLDQKISFHFSYTIYYSIFV